MPDDPHTINYAAAEAKHTSMPTAGLAAFLLVVFQCFWLPGLVFASISGHLDAGQSDLLEGYSGLIITWFPSLVAFGLSTYDLARRGIGVKNIAGVIAFICSAVVVVILLLGAIKSLHWRHIFSS